MRCGKGWPAIVTAFSFFLARGTRVAINARPGARPETGFRRSDVLGLLATKFHLVLLLSVADETARLPILFVVGGLEKQGRRRRQPHGKFRAGFWEKRKEGVARMEILPKSPNCDVADCQEQCR